jgi:hypothetical protein
VGCGINLLLVLGALVFPLYIAYMTRLWLVAVVRVRIVADILEVRVVLVDY